MEDYEIDYEEMDYDESEHSSSNIWKILMGIFILVIIIGISYAIYKWWKGKEYICDTRKSSSEPDSCMNCVNGYENRGINDWCCSEDKKGICNVKKPGDSTAGAICDTRVSSGGDNSCLDCRYGFIRKGLNDWCCQKKEQSNCNQIKINPDGSKSYTNKGGSMCDTRKETKAADSCLNCNHGFIRKGLNDWCCQEFEKDNCNQIKTKPDGSKSYTNIGGTMCDTRKAAKEADSCLNCDNGYIRKGLNDWCCKKDEKNCTQLKTNPDGTKSYKNNGGSICDTRKDPKEADSCKNCEFGRVKKGLNDWCCKKEENCVIENPHFKKPPKNKGGSICDTRKSDNLKDSCKLCEFGRVRKGLNDWCCRKSENCHTNNPHFKQPPKNNGGKVCDTRKPKQKSDSCKLCKYGRVKKGLNDWCCRKSENCHTDNPYFKQPSKNNGGSKCDTRKPKHKSDSCKLCKYGRVRKGLNDWCCRKSENCKTDNLHYVKPFWSGCYKDEECSGRRDDCIKRDCRKKGLKYKGKWRDCGGWRFKGYCH